MSERQREVEDQRGLASVRETKLAEARAVIEERSGEVERLRGELEDAERRAVDAAELRGELEERNGELAEARQAIEERGGEAERLRAELADAETRAAELDR